MKKIIIIAVLAFLANTCFAQSQSREATVTGGYPNGEKIEVRVSFIVNDSLHHDKLYIRPIPSVHDKDGSRLGRDILLQFYSDRVNGWPTKVNVEINADTLTYITDLARK